MSELNHVDIKLVYTSLDKDHTDKQLKHTLSKIIDVPGLDIFIKKPYSDEYSRLSKEMV